MRARRAADPGGLSITSLMDAMTIILCFLLKQFSATDVTVAASDELTIPASSASKQVERAVQVVVTRGALLVEGTRVADVRGDTWEVDGERNGRLIVGLYDALLAQHEDAEAAGAAVGAEVSGRLLLQADRTMPFSVLRDVMYTAGQARFGQVRLVVLQGG